MPYPVITFPPPPPTSNNMTAERRAQLMRSSTKLGKVLGSTPHVVDVIMSPGEQRLRFHPMLGAQPLCSLARRHSCRFESCSPTPFPLAEQIPPCAPARCQRKCVPQREPCLYRIAIIHLLADVRHEPHVFPLRTRRAGLADAISRAAPAPPQNHLSLSLSARGPFISPAQQTLGVRTALEAVHPRGADVQSAVCRCAPPRQDAPPHSPSGQWRPAGARLPSRARGGRRRQRLGLRHSPAYAA